MDPNAYAGLPYEVSLAGVFPSVDEANVLNRLTLNCADCVPLDLREVVLEPRLRPQNDEPVLLRCRRENGKWSLVALLRPLPDRMYPDVTVRPAAFSTVLSGDPLAFASALGYRRVRETRREGYIFKRSNLVIQVYRSQQIDPETDEPVPGVPDAPFEIEVKSTALRNAAEDPLQQIIDSILDVRTLMKGLLDLEKVEER